MIFAHPHVTGNRGRERSGREEKFHLKKTKIKLCLVKTCWEEKRRWPTRVQLQPTSWVTPPHNMVSPDQPMCECVCLCVIFRDTLSIWRWPFMSSRSVTAFQRETGQQTSKESCHQKSKEERKDGGSRLWQRIPAGTVLPGINVLLWRSSCHVRVSVGRSIV